MAEKIKIQPARPEDAGALTEIAIAAKGYWGYPEDWIRRWKEELTVTPDYVRAHPTYAATLDGALVGFCAILLQSEGAVLDHLWVSPATIRRGVGRALFAQAEKIARQAGAARMKIAGDPHAEDFYRSMGATVYGRKPATIDGQERSLPLFEKTLA